MGERKPHIAGKETALYVYDLREPVYVSWARDVATFGGLIATAYALNVLMPPSGWLNAALGVTWFLWILGRSYKLRHRMTPDEVRAWLDAEHPAA